MRVPSRTTISMGKMTLEDGNALLLVGLQRDILPGGSLPIAGAPAIIPTANRYVAAWEGLGQPIVLSRCWHPPGHCSFQDRGGPWPAHAIADSHGAAFADGLRVPETRIVVSTGTEPDADGASAFAGTDLAAQLRSRGTTQVFVGGVATEHAVLETVRNALALDFATVVLRDATAGVNARPDDAAQAETAMAELGAQLITLSTLGL